MDRVLRNRDFTVCLKIYVFWIILNKFLDINHNFNKEKCSNINCYILNNHEVLLKISINIYI